MAFGPAAGFEIVDALSAEPALTENERERAFLRARASGIGGGSS